MPTPAPACKAALAEATRLWPNRSRASDGIMGDLRHQALPSDHNDGNAFDLTHDPVNGCDAHRLVRELVARSDPRVKYAISNGQIWSALYAAKGWRRYTGPNPHNKHAHVSITWAARDNTAPWWVAQRKAPIVVHNHVRTLVAPNGGYWHLQADGGIITADNGVGGPEAPYLGSIPEPGDTADFKDGAVAVDLVPHRGGYAIIARHPGDIVSAYHFPAA